MPRNGNKKLPIELVCHARVHPRHGRLNDGVTRWVEPLSHGEKKEISPNLDGTKKKSKNAVRIKSSICNTLKWYKRGANYYTGGSRSIFVRICLVLHSNSCLTSTDSIVLFLAVFSASPAKRRHCHQRDPVATFQSQGMKAKSMICSTVHIFHNSFLSTGSRTKYLLTPAQFTARYNRNSGRLRSMVSGKDWDTSLNAPTPGIPII
jgi:hypothetical protein